LKSMLAGGVSALEKIANSEDSTATSDSSATQ
jgi:hypothetical protein